MRILPHCGRTAAVILLVAFVINQPLAGNGRCYFDLSGGFKTGTFGTAVRSNLVYCAPAIGYAARRYEASITIPYLFLATYTTDAVRTGGENGIGDIILRTGWTAVSAGPRGFSLDAVLAVKLGTADATRGLGSGATDLGVFLNGNQLVAGTKFTLMAGYIKTGRSISVSFNDLFLYGAGVSRIVGFNEPYLSLEGRSAIVSGAQNPLELHMGLFRLMNLNYALKGGVFTGFNNGGPRLGFECGLVRWF
jgi:hypothetical protein